MDHHGSGAATRSVTDLAQTGAAGMARARLVALETIDTAAWQDLCTRAIEPNGFFDPAFSRPAFALAEKGGPARALIAEDEHGRLIGFLPVVSLWRNQRLPLPALVAHQPYSPLGTPLLDKEFSAIAAGALIDAAAKSGAAAIVLPWMPLDGHAAGAITLALSERGMAPQIERPYGRAAFNATTPDLETYLRDGFGSKRLKDSRRLRNRLEEQGAVTLDIADTPDIIAPALDRFLVLEASGWKGRGGTGLGQHQGDAAFIRKAALDMGAKGNFEIVELCLNGKPVASGLLMAQGDRSFFFKIAFDEAMAKLSVGVQLALELTRRYAADPRISFVDSTADAGHPMIDPIWSERLAVGTMIVPTRRKDPRFTPITKLMAARHTAREWVKAQLAAIRHRKETKK